MTILDKYTSKREQLENKRQEFRRFVELEINTDCFERNAIPMLLSMLELKTEISTLGEMPSAVRYE